MVIDPVARGQHEGNDPVDHDQAGICGNEIDPSVPLVQLRIQLVPTVEVEQPGRNFEKEEDPLDSPAPEVDMNQVAGRGGTDQADGEPDSYAGYRSEDDREQHEEPGMEL